MRADAIRPYGFGRARSPLRREGMEPLPYDKTGRYRIRPYMVEDG